MQKGSWILASLADARQECEKHARWFYARVKFSIYRTHLEADRLRVPTRFGVLFSENALLTFLVVRFATLR